MVREKDNCYYCEECEMVYVEKNKACECEGHCKKLKVCSLEIIKHAVTKKEGKQ